MGAGRKVSKEERAARKEERAARKAARRRVELKLAGCLDGPQPGDEGVYLLHFDRRYKHAGHYIGWSNQLGRRLVHHELADALSVPLVRAARAEGIGWQLAKVWRFKGRHFERRVKSWGSAVKHCPICNGTADVDIAW